MGERRVCLGVVAGPHGVRGLVKVKAFTEVPESIAAYGPLTDEDGREHFGVEILGKASGMILARLEGVSDRDQAVALRGTRLFVLRSALPAPTEEEFYHADLIGMSAVSASGQDIGKVHAVHNFGAGDILEIRTAEGGSLDLPFTKAAVPKVDLAAGCLTVILPEDSDEDPTPGKDAGR